MDIQVGAVARHGPRQAIHIRTGTALQGHLHAAIRRQPGFAGHYRVEGDGRVTFDSDSLAIQACGVIGPKANRDLAIIRSAQGRYYVEPLVENLESRTHASEELFLAGQVLEADGHVGAALTRVVLSQTPDTVAVHAS